MELPVRKRLRTDPTYAKEWKDYVTELKDILEDELEQYLYFDFIEHNQSEGETWHFYCKYAKTDEQHMEDVLDRLCTELEDSDYELGYYGMTEEDVTKLIKFTDHGYMAYHNRGPFYTSQEIDKFLNCRICCDDFDDWNKGGFSLACNHSIIEETEYCEGCGDEGGLCMSCDRSRCKNCKKLLKGFDGDNCSTCRRVLRSLGSSPHCP
jgi:hypothetical protein